jgi:flagellar motor switch protein FliN/FliY
MDSEEIDRAGNQGEGGHDNMTESYGESTSIGDNGPQSGDLVFMNNQGGSTPASKGSIQAARFSPLSQAPVQVETNSMDLLMDVNLELSVELGRTSIPVREVLQLGPGSIVELEKLAGEPVDILINGKLIARGEVVVVDESFGVRVTEIASQSERWSRLA